MEPDAPSRALGCVALPVLAKDIGPNLESVFQLWSDPRCYLLVGQMEHLPHLMVVINCADEALLAATKALYNRYPTLAQCFSGFSAHSAELRGDRDLYARKSPTAMGKFGNKAGPNFLFQETMNFAEAHGGFTLQIELDCIPIEAGWLAETVRVVNGNQRAWVIGSMYSGDHGLERSVQTHLNGNALYNTGDPDFMRFLNEIWIADLVNIAQKRPNLAYDCWWANEQSQA
ncbi:MAG: hypothetical protein ABI832_03800, partial [bacterium]